MIIYKKGALVRSFFCCAPIDFPNLICYTPEGNLQKEDA